MGYTMSTPLHGAQHQEWKTFSRQQVMTALRGFGGLLWYNRMVVAYRHSGENLGRKYSRNCLKISCPGIKL